MGPSQPISLADHRARRLVTRLVAVQQQIDRSARVLLAGRKCDLKLEVLLDDMDRVLVELRTTAPHVRRPELQTAIGETCCAHARWSRARLGSDEERSAAARYLDSVDTLAQLATARG